MKRVLVVAAHADDEVLGCGGTIAKHDGCGDHVSIVFMADGVSSRTYVADGELKLRNSAADAAAAILGIKEIIHLGLPDNRMDSLPLLEIVQKLEPVIEKLMPDVVYTHHYGDLNIDHRVTCQAVMTACRPIPGASIKEIYSFEVMSSTEWAVPAMEPFLPNCYVDITEVLSRKMAALKAYSLEMREYPHSRSEEHLEYLAKYRGGCVGVEAAEAFSTIRLIR